MAGSVVGGIASGLAGKSLGKVFGGGKSSSAGSVSPLFLNAGGLSTFMDTQGRLRVKSSAERKALNDSIRNNYLGLASGIRDYMPQFDSIFNRGLGDIEGLIEQVRPGFGRLTEARVDSIDRARERQRGNLSQELSKRRVSGSSFGQDQLLSAEAEFAKQEQESRALSFLEELELTSNLQKERNALALQGLETNFNLFSQALSAERAADQTSLDELNFQLNLVTGLMGGVQNQLNRNANLAVDDVLAKNTFAGNIAGNIFGSSGFQDFFGGLFK